MRLVCHLTPAAPMHLPPTTTQQIGMGVGFSLTNNAVDVEAIRTSVHSVTVEGKAGFARSKLRTCRRSDQEHSLLDRKVIY